MEDLTLLARQAVDAKYAAEEAQDARGEALDFFCEAAAYAYGYVVRQIASGPTYRQYEAPHYGETIRVLVTNVAAPYHEPIWQVRVVQGACLIMLARADDVIIPDPDYRAMWNEVGVGVLASIACMDEPAKHYLASLAVHFRMLG